MRSAGETKFCGDDHLIAHRSKPFANYLFIDERAINLGGIEEGYAALSRAAHHSDHLFLGASDRAMAFAHPHAAEPDRRYFQITVSQFALLHCVSYCLSSSNTFFATAIADMALGHPE